MMGSIGHGAKFIDIPEVKAAILWMPPFNARS